MPIWRSAPFWPVLQPSGKGFAKFVKAYKILPQCNVIEMGYGNNGIFGLNPLPFHMVALKIDFSEES